MSRFLRSLVSVFYSSLRFLLLKIIYQQHFQFKGSQRFSKRTPLFMIKKGSIHLGNKVRAHNGTKLRSVAATILKIGENSVISGGNVVTKNISDNIIAAGNSCRVLKPINK
jgi:hypothetical protein